MKVLPMHLVLSLLTIMVSVANEPLRDNLVLVTAAGAEPNLNGAIVESSDGYMWRVVKFQDRRGDMPGIYWLKLKPSAGFWDPIREGGWVRFPTVSEFKKQYRLIAR